MSNIEELLVRLEPLRERARQILESKEVQRKIDWAQKSAKKLVDTYPVGSIAGAVLLGYLVGKLLKDDDEE